MACKIAAVLVLRRALTSVLASATGSWDAVRGLESGARIQAVRRAAKIAQKREVGKGRFAPVTDDEVIVLISGGNSNTFLNDAIEQIQIRRPILNRRPTGLGCLIAGGLMGWAGGYLGELAGFAIGFLKTCG